MIDNLFASRLFNMSYFNNKASDVFSGLLIIVSISIILTFGASNYITKTITGGFESKAYSLDDSEHDVEVASVAEVVVQNGDSLGKIFQKQNINSLDSHKIIQSLANNKVNIVIKPGQVIKFDYEISDEDEEYTEYKLKKISIALGRQRNIFITKTETGFDIKDIKAELIKKFVKHNVVISNSFVSSLKSVGVSASNIQEIVKAYSYNIDFQRQIKKGDSIKIICEKFYSEDGNFVNSGKILYASLKLSGNENNIYLFRPNGIKTAQYFNENAKSVKRSLLRTPLDVVKISSKYGMRKHPVLGYTKMHKGIDFAAPTGTPIKAAGDGIVEDMGYKGAYGNIITIRHNSSMVTAYAHASRFAKNIKRGSRVKQGQVIAYVGKTGRATGPHCHHEVRINGRHVNPLTIQSTPSDKLSGKNLKLFDSYKKSIKNYAKILEEGKEIELSIG
jgi:murein DD-endopeptidase MepM/ murein hydrolase activator NlpD